MKLSDNYCMPKILIIDDEPQIIRVLRIALSSQGYLLRAAANGGEGIAILQNWQPDLVLTDISMSKMNGIDFCRQLREVSEAPLIVLSACTLLSRSACKNFKLEFASNQDVWRTDDDRPEQVRVHIGQLRKKMKFSDDPQYIVTEPWIGYRFCATGKDL